MISAKVSGSFAKTEAWLKRMKTLKIQSVLDANGRLGVSALASATPIDSSRAAGSWRYRTSAKGGVYSLIWTNSDIEEGFPVSIMLQYGYGTGTGGYVQGRDYINPAIRPVFDKIANAVWKAVTSA